jgi:hypothetical protein
MFNLGVNSFYIANMQDKGKIVFLIQQPTKWCFCRAIIFLPKFRHQGVAIYLFINKYIYAISISGVVLRIA